MHIESLEYFREVVECKSISKVANKSHISQSALSQLIQKIEDSLNSKLLNRSNRGVEPTDIGKIVLKYSNNILKTYEKMMEEIEDFEKSTHTIRINAERSLVTYSLPCALYKVKKKYSKHKYELVSSKKDEIINDVRNDICDMGVINENISEIDLDVNRIGREKVVLVAEKDFRIPDKITIEELFNYDIIALSNAYYISSKICEKLGRFGKCEDDLKILFNIDSIGAVKSSVHNGYGISFLPYMAVKKELYSGLYKIIEIEDFDLSYDIFLLHKSYDKLSSSSCETIKYFIEMGDKSFC
ncbi:LysR family transcriptional regulator [Helicovermis profundi]|uniref:LysR family transcriptional regulator n=1 Tax=Helicovermis profundi TaxID=3065157 RepID=A0AAU9EKK7_9FIRM|nr:LysR family transcriptional regulator [Clostridia bacterium S502]